MLAMAQVKYIKHLRDKEDSSIGNIARTIGINWRTAKKYADQDDWNAELSQKRKCNRPVIGPYEEIIEIWLLEDRNVPKKHRHTARRIFDRLVAEHGFKGSQRTVRSYVAERKKVLYKEEREKFVKLEHPGAEAQVDYGTITVVESGKFKQQNCLILSFPYSNAGFPYVLPSENSLCFLEGLKRLFEHIGGAPRKIWFDNLPAAVVKVLTGNDRKLTDIFERFQLHYRFESQFCNVRRGNEKGNVENKVGFSRRNFLVPIPEAQCIESLNRELLKRAEEDMNRPHYEKKTFISQLWEKEKQQILSLPTVPFEVVKLESAVVNNYCRINYEKNTYDVPKASPGNRLILKVFWDRIEVLDQEYQHMYTLPQHYQSKEYEIDWQEHIKLLSRKPRALPYSTFLTYMPPAVKEYLLNDDARITRDRLKLISELLKDHTIDEVACAIEGSAKKGRQDASSIRHMIYRNANNTLSPEPLKEQYTPACLIGYDPDLTKYEHLAKGGASNDPKLT